MRVLHQVAALGQFLLRRAAELFMMALALIMFANVMGRYVINIALPGAVEMVEIMLVGVIFTGILLTTLRSEHVVVDVLTGAFKPRWRRFAQIVGHSLAAVTSAVLGLSTWQDALLAFDYGAITTELSIPLAPVVFFMSIAMLMNAMLELWVLWHPRATAGGSVL